MMNHKRRLLIVALAFVAVVGVAFGAMFVLWSRQPTLLVSNQLYTAELFQPTVNVVADKSVVATQWYRQPDDHHYQIAIVIDEMNQIDSGILSITVPNLNSTLTSLNISSVDVWTVYFDGSLWQVGNVQNLAANQPLGTPITILKTDVVYLSAGTSHNGYTDKRAIIITLSEYQLVPTTEPTTNYNTVIELGV